MNQNVNVDDLYVSMENYINQKIETKEGYKQTRQEKLKNGKLGRIEAFTTNREFKQFQAEIGQLNQLKQVMFQLNSIEAEVPEFPESFMENMGSLCGLLDEKQARELNQAVNRSLSGVNQAKKEEVQKKVIEVQKLLKKLNLEHATVMELDFSGKQKVDGLSKSFATVLEQYGKGKEQSFTPNRVSFHDSIGKNSFVSSQEMKFSTVDKMIQNHQVANDPILKDMIQNLGEIKKATLAKDKALEANLLITNVMNDLKGIPGVDFTEVIHMLQTISQENKKVIADSEKYLSKFNLAYLEEKVQAYEKEEQEKKEQQATQQNYQDLVYQLAKLEKEDPNNFQAIQEVKDQMSKVARNATNEQLSDAQLAGRTQYHEEQYQKTAIAEQIQKELKIHDDAMAEAQRGLRAVAIQELESSNAFNDQFYQKNGDVYSTMTASEKENLIQQKMDEMSKLASMTPEERGLQDLKKRGYLPQDATLASLTPQQKADFRYAYRDDSYPFMKDFKKKQKDLDLSTKKQTTTVYKEYVKYLASQKDKDKAVSFSDYAKLQFGYTNMNTEMVDGEVKVGRSR